MKPIIDFLKMTLQDEIFSKQEKQSFRKLLQEAHMNNAELTELKNKIFSLAGSAVNGSNYPFIMDWLKTATTMVEQPPAPVMAAFFSPGDACKTAITNQILSATSTLRICVFTISDDSIKDCLLTAHKRGTKIQLITDNDKSWDEGSDIQDLAAAGIPVKMDATPNHMHHKFMITDNRALITGSYNWTRSAARYNHENIVLSHEPAVIKSFASQFDHLWKIMVPYK